MHNRSIHYINTTYHSMKANKLKKKGVQSMRDELQDTLANPEIADYCKKLKAGIQKLRSILTRWTITKSKYYGDYMPNKEVHLIKAYLEAQRQYYEEDQFREEDCILLDNFDVNFSFIEDYKLLLKSFQLFPKTIWPIRFHSKFVSRIQGINKPDEIYLILAHVYRLACGTVTTDSIGTAKSIHTKTIPFNRFLTVKLIKEKNMFVHIGVEKVPVVKNGVIKRYQFTQYMHFLDVLGDHFVQNRSKCDQRMNHFTNTIYNDAAKKDHSEQLEIDREKFTKTNHNHHQKHYFFNQVKNDYTERFEYYQSVLPSKQSKSTCFYPIPFRPYYVSVAQNTTVIFDKNMNRWVSKDYLTALERKKIILYQKQINDVMIKRFICFQSAKSLVELLTKIPNFKVNLTEQQKDVIGENGNVLAIGRSGTGKTTCAVLRLFSIEMLFKIRSSLYKKKFQDTIEGVRCDSNDIDNTTGLHCIFLTASPVLTHEIQRYYKKLTDNIKSQLQKKKKKVQEQRAQRQEEESVQKTSNVEIQQEILQPSDSKNQNLQVPQQLELQKSAEDLQEQQEINQQFQGIELKQDIKNQQFKEEQQDIDQLKNKFQQSIKKFHTLYDLNQSDYPGFFTVKSFIMMIDGVLSKPFFIRSKNTVVGQQSKSSWHNERKGVMMIQNYYRGEDEKADLNLQNIQEEFNYSDQEELQHQYLRQIQLKENKEKQQLTKKLQKNKIANVFSFQVDYDYFVVHFWPIVVKKYYSSRNITPHLVWTEIFSTIKGSAQAHQYPGCYLNQNTYLRLSTNAFLTKEQKMDIYQTFCQYQRWKIRAGGYDIMDAVNYILNYIRFRGYEGPCIHYVMIDQVQDLPHAIIYLLSKIATYGVFYSGDTAQTIAKGVGFRFSDLLSLYTKVKLQPPVIKHLTVNFRSHNNILQLANSIVSSLEILFPKTIDRLKKEVSDLTGPKPMILSANDQELLFYVLCGGEEKVIEEGNTMKKPPLQFGCDQVIIVRDQESKAKIPSMLQHALCLTIYEAKGLEFNDVILFNFFQESPCPQKWSLLKCLNVVTVEMSKEDYQKNLSRHKQMNKQQKQQNKLQQANKQQDEHEQIQVQNLFNKQKNVYQVKKITSNTTKIFKDINDFSQLCSQLKLLYTAITRPKKTLIIYDDGSAVARSSIERIWERLNVIEIITKQVVMSNLNKKSNLAEEIKIFKTIATATDKSQWKQQGLKMYSRGYFDQAMKCFERSGSIDLYKKAQANKYADQATKKLIEIQSQRNTIKQGNNHIKGMSSSQISKYKKQLKGEQSTSLKKFLQAGKIFQQLLMFKQAGQCFFSGKSFEKAFQSFCKAFMNKQAGESLEMQNKYREAAQYYQKDDNYLKVIECLDMVNEWVPILQKIQRFADKMSDYEKQALLKKYSALALEQLVYQIQFQNEEQNNKPENNRVQVIEEKQSDEQEQWDSQEDPELAAQRQYQRKLSSQQSNPSRKQSQVEQPKAIIDIKESVYQQLGQKKQHSSEVKLEKDDPSMSFSQLNNSEVQISEQKGMMSVDESFGELNRSDAPLVLEQQKEQKKDLESIESSFDDLNAKYQNDLEPDLESIKSMVDPDDIWVKNSISEITHKLHSQYSVIDNQEENYNINVKIIKTKGNIFVQDQIMRKIVNIVSIINSSVSQFFTQFKGYQSLITVSKDEKTQEIDNRPQISQFEDIDPKFINIILDTLESFKLFKLCLFVCNRYHLPSKAGRYLISLGMKYSTNCISNNVVNPILLAPSSYRKLQIQKGILASIAIHAIYQNVNAEFLKVKVTDDDEENKQTLGTYFIEGLILCGMYKKAVFMVNPQESLKILANYNDFQAYNNIFKQKILKKSTDDSFNFLPHPKTKEEIQFTKILLRKVIFQYCVVKKYESLSQRYYKQFQNQGQSLALKRLSQFNVPNYLPFTKLLITELNPENFMHIFKKLIEKGYSILTKGTNLQNLDFVCTMLAILHNQQMQRCLVDIFNNNQFLQFYRCCNFIKTVLRKISVKNSLKIIQAVLNMHLCYRINYCKSMTFVNDTFCFVNRISTVANELVENQKTNSGNFSFFFEQDYNLILTKTSRVIKIIAKKYQDTLARLFQKRIQANHYYNKYFLHEDWIAAQQELVIKKALSFELKRMDQRKKKKEQTTVRKKSKQLKTSYDFKNRGRDHVITIGQSSESEQQQQYVDKQIKFHRYNQNPRLKYLASSMIHWFNEQSSNAKDIVQGRYLYGCGLNSSYREYIHRQGGFNLFDALEFHKFKRIDLFAENILSVYDKLTLYTRQNLLPQILVLLLVQYKSIEQPKGFSIKLTSDCLKYFENLQIIGLRQNPSQKNAINTLVSNNIECKFSYLNKYVSEMSKKDISAVICDFLDVLQDEGGSHFFNYSNLLLFYVINIGKDNQINEALRKVIKALGNQPKSQSLHYLVDSKTLNQFEKKKKELLGSSIKRISQCLHEIVVDSKGDLKAAIQQSEFDYEVEGRILKGRKKAVLKIEKWWKAKKIDLKTKRGAAQNYLQLAIDPSIIPQAKKPLTIGDIRLLSIIHKSNSLHDIDFLIKTQKAKTQLLSFYLTNTISSSLDFHFILMSLNNIQKCRKHYFQYCSEDIDQLHQFDIDQIHQEMEELLQTIEIWKKDQKWLREKNVNFKKKKVFEVKWMTKSLNFSNILKKRAGLKKQNLLQEKKRAIKKIK